MLRFLLSLLIVLLISPSITAKPKIFVSIKPIAALVAMLGQDLIEIQTSSNFSGCPHDYSAKPSDLAKVRAADLVIYIHEDFDVFAAKLAKSGNSQNIVKIGSFANLNIIPYNKHHNNWHLWLDLHNAGIILENLSTILINKFPELKNAIRFNLSQAMDMIEDLDKVRKAKLSGLKEVILLSDSLEYFFIAGGYKVKKMYTTAFNHSLKFADNVNKALEESSGKCAVIASSDYFNLYKKIKANIIQLDGENWPDISGVQLWDEYVYNYSAMLEHMTGCLSHNHATSCVIN